MGLSVTPLIFAAKRKQRSQSTLFQLSTTMLLVAKSQKSLLTGSKVIFTDDFEFSCNLFLKALV